MKTKHLLEALVIIGLVFGFLAFPYSKMERTTAKALGMWWQDIPTTTAPYKSGGPGCECK